MKIAEHNVRHRPASHYESTLERLNVIANRSHATDQTRPLTSQQKAAIKFIAAGESIISAALKAGYKDNAMSLYRIARRPKVKELIAKEKAKYEEAAQMTRKKVMDGLLESVAMAKLMSEPASMISGWREIGKMCGYYEPTRRNVTLTIEGSAAMQQLSRLTDAELLRVIQGEVIEPLQIEMTDDSEK